MFNRIRRKQRNRGESRYALALGCIHGVVYIRVYICVHRGREKEKKGERQTNERERKRKS